MSANRTASSPSLETKQEERPCPLTSPEEGRSSTKASSMISESHWIKVNSLNQPFASAISRTPQALTSHTQHTAANTSKPHSLANNKSEENISWIFLTPRNKGMFVVASSQFWSIFRHSLIY
jgi:hypothetical protein